MKQALQQVPDMQEKKIFQTTIENALMRLAERALTFALRSHIRPNLTSQENEASDFPPPH
jgi:hypothetical protein